MSKEIQLTQGKVALVDDENYEWLDQWRWYALYNQRGHTWYAVRAFYKQNEQRKILMHRLILNANQPLQVDHINHDGLDNRRCNLRLATHAQNQMNSVKRKGTSSKFKGVSFYKTTKVWQAHIRINKYKIRLGYFNSEQEAALAYNEAAINYFGDYAYLNMVEK